MQFFLHVGAHKTATTHLQTRLTKARPQLWHRRVACIGPNQTRAGEVQLSTLTQFPGRWPASEAAWRKRLDLIEADGIARCIISEENLIGEIRPRLLVGRDGTTYPEAVPRMEALAHILGRRPDRIFLSLREPASFVTSAFGMWLRAGHGALIEEFLVGADPRGMRWADLGARLATLPGQPDLIVWRFEDYPRLRNDVVAAMIGPDAAGVVGTSPRKLVGWSQAAYDAFVDSVLADDGSTPQSALAQVAMTAFPRGPQYPGFAVLSPDVLRECAAQYAVDVARLAAMPQVNLIE